MASVVKKRRKKIARHKYRKRLKRDRWKKRHK
ncbi:MAG: AURKAIP1/COX24 domain-containing protein [Anaerolineae bacterium]|nr:AURKAIP1/COX24 domain-containing protein [Anaerolineae bacterium]NIN93749.1 AURKAIP1/COX24 domain-containing protein [Anaerolineae bacterium]NIQ76787.1 AURKAIP1/COX24 domain-containing protein [Anaerolineae bacterium]